MGTTALTYIFNKHMEPICSLLRTSNGRPQWHGRELADYFGDYKVSDGVIGKPHHSNGMGCFAASLVSHFKSEEGEFYLVYAGDERDEDFTYQIYPLVNDGPLQLKLIKDISWDNEEELYCGNLSDFGKWLDETYGPSEFVVYLTPPESL
jgi:hypothetical protein